MSRPIPLAGGALLASLLLLAPRASIPSALAQEAPADATEDAEDAAESPASADPIVHAILVEAVAEYEAAHYAEAQALFRRASELAPSGRTLRGLGMASYELRQYATAILALEAAQAATERPLTEAQRAHVADLLARARGFVAPVRFRLEPAEAALRIDGVVTTLGVDGSVLLDPGRHLVVVDHAGFRPESLDVSLEPGVARELAITLTPQVAAPPVRAGDQEPLGWASASLGIVASLGLAASAVTGIIALTDDQALASDCRSFVCPDSTRSARDRARDLSVVTDVVGTASAIVGATALTLALVAALGGGESDTTAAAAAACDGAGCVVLVRGCF